ncbi:MAG TPA: hypothetical protein DCL40_02170 [Coxiellaceae bacterium]|nr:hypothetical protein [Coxiellaceae bacterium]
MPIIDNQPITTGLLEEDSAISPVIANQILQVSSVTHRQNQRNTNVRLGRPATLADNIWHRIIGPHFGWLCADDGTAPSYLEEDDCCVQICHIVSLIAIPAIILTPLAQWSSQLWLAGCSAFLHISPFYNPLAIGANIISNCCLFSLYTCFIPLCGDNSFYRRETFTNHCIPSTLSNQWFHTIFTTPIVPWCCPSILPTLTCTMISSSLILPSACLVTSCIAGGCGAYTTQSTDRIPTVTAEPINLIGSIHLSDNNERDALGLI